ncbi:MAG: zinc-dependent alcohol dehydrogenase family protein [Rhodoferax sp.]|uniref:zinc-dependent alcohol dehydrogenase family protein n=1 Tax=Rhodoferax sp. TaxID=50421 RepID=UPI0017D7F5A4|nr:zinc-dependent alcohol dehydrogenase family protein [Rhodoferax sp.]NMM12387.1 zinc-dependent alcohol dehydrogenase family protein [Rhodoferax sp.]NMM18746.1 zinc-dependent alcohol dehydrogenase family protein [Rhodoferax sp.]
MRAMTLGAPGQPLILADLPMPVPGPHDLLLQVLACGVCRTDLHIVDGELPARPPGTVPGHEVVGRVAAVGQLATRFQLGDRVGVPWLGGTCGHCAYCAGGRENLCDQPVFTGYDRPGGFADYVVADERFCFSLPDRYDDVHAAPLLCAGLIGYRAYRLSGVAGAMRLGLYGFGAAAHIICQIAVAQGQQVYAFVRPGDLRGQRFARQLGACWAGSSDTQPDVNLDAALIFAPVGSLVPTALRAIRKGGVVVCAGIHMSDIPSFEYALLWGERSVRSVANLTREDGENFFSLIERYPVTTHVQPFALAQANEAIAAVRSGMVEGAAVLVP